MNVDATTALAWVRAWGVESVLAGLALAGVLLGWTGGDGPLLVLGLVLALATVDRVRLVLDNRSLAAAVSETGDPRVSAARRSSVDGTEPTRRERAERDDPEREERPRRTTETDS